MPRDPRMPPLRPAAPHGRPRSPEPGPETARDDHDAVAAALAAGAEHFLARGVVRAPMWHWRAAALLRRRALDARLRAGGNPLEHAPLAARAWQITRPHAAGAWRGRCASWPRHTTRAAACS